GGRRRGQAPSRRRAPPGRRRHRRLTVRLVLDTSALLAYVAADVRSVEVGELIATVEENGDTTGVPVSCLLVALARVGADERRKLFELTGVDGPILLLPLLASDV